MKHILLSAAVVSTLALPALAQSSNRADPNRDYRSDAASYGGGEFPARIEQMQVRVRTGVQNGAITRQEAAALRQQLRQVSQLHSQYASNGLSSQERADLQDELRDIRQDVRLAESRNQYAEGDDDALDERRYDRDGRLIRNPEPTQRRTLGGIIDGVVGGGSTPK